VSAWRRAAPRGRAGVPVWDGAVRVLHALLAGAVLFTLVVDDGGPVHRAVGYAAAGVVAARLLHACIARGTNGLAALRPSLRDTIAWLRSGAPRTAGHDPLGIWMVWLLWALVGLLAATGWMSRLDTFWGDDGVRAVHAWLADALTIAVAAHLAGVAAMSLHWQENLPLTMVTGRRRDYDQPG